MSSINPIVSPAILRPENLNLAMLVADSDALPLEVKAFLLKQRKGTGAFANLDKAYTVISLILNGEISFSQGQKPYFAGVPITVERLAGATGLRKPILKKFIIHPLEVLKVIAIKRIKRYGNKDKKKNLCYEYSLCAPFSMQSGATPIPLTIGHKLSGGQSEAASSSLHRNIAPKTDVQKRLLLNLERLRLDVGCYSYVESESFADEAKRRQLKSRANNHQPIEAIRQRAKMLIGGINAEAKASLDGDAVPGWFFNGDNLVGRVFSSITMLPKELRDYLRLEGQELVEVDQRASQPFLLLAFYREMQGDNEAIRRESNDYYGLWEGDFYTNFARLSGVAMSRDDMKAAFVAGLNAKDWKSAPPEVNKQVLRIILKTFENRFPLLYGAILRLKNIRNTEIAATLKPDRKGHEKVYSQFGIRLQQIESDVFINGIAAELTQRNIFICTIHDCVMCLEKDVPAVKDCMSRHLKAKTGFAPAFKVGASSQNGEPSYAQN